MPSVAGGRVARLICLVALLGACSDGTQPEAVPDPFAPPPGDQDRDDVPDGTDNCPDRFNPNQTDSNDDGLGDRCDGTRELAACHPAQLALHCGRVRITTGARAPFGGLPVKIEVRNLDGQVEGYVPSETGSLIRIVDLLSGGGFATSVGKLRGTIAGFTIRTEGEAGVLGDSLSALDWVARTDSVSPDDWPDGLQVMGVETAQSWGAEEALNNIGIVGCTFDPAAVQESGAFQTCAAPDETAWVVFEFEFFERNDVGWTADDVLLRWHFDTPESGAEGACGDGEIASPRCVDVR